MRIDYPPRKREYQDVPAGGLVVIDSGGQVCFALKAVVSDETDAGYVILSGIDGFTLIDQTVPRGAMLSLDGAILRPSLTLADLDLQGDDGPRVGQLCLVRDGIHVVFQYQRRLALIDAETGVLADLPELRDRVFINKWSIVHMVDERPVALLECPP